MLFPITSIIVQLEHFTLEQGSITGMTKEGRASVFLLRFNDEVRVSQRLQLIQHGRYPTF